MYKYLEINNMQTYILLITLNVPLQIGKCTLEGTYTPDREPLVCNDFGYNDSLPTTALFPRSRQNSYRLHAFEFSYSDSLRRHFAYTDAFCRSPQNVLFVHNDSWKCKLAHVDLPQIFYDRINTPLKAARR